MYESERRRYTSRQSTIGHIHADSSVRVELNVFKTVSMYHAVERSRAYSIDDRRDSYFEVTYAIEFLASSLMITHMRHHAGK